MGSSIRRFMAQIGKRRKRMSRKTIFIDNDKPLEGCKTERHLPLNRGECENSVRPCPYISCIYHLYLDVSPKGGSIIQNFPDLEPHQLKETCALDVVYKNPTGLTLEEVGDLFGLTRERIRQVERVAIIKFQSVFTKRFGPNWREALSPDPTDDGKTFRSILSQVMEE